MGDTSTLTLKKSTVELVGKVKRKMAFNEDKSFSNDEVITKLCEEELIEPDIDNPNRKIMGKGFDCSNCGANYNYLFNFCPDCGHKHKKG